MLSFLSYSHTHSHIDYFCHAALDSPRASYETVRVRCPMRKVDQVSLAAAKFRPSFFGRKGAVWWPWWEEPQDHTTAFSEWQRGGVNTRLEFF